VKWLPKAEFSSNNTNSFNTLTSPFLINYN